ncbi:DNA translocase FtsK [Chthonobacter rhizosphaerae]|uniref:DNA translocase FtsK n=1 Tax=Chthonobacter rhizosphaerae TaxID=2735553 RepID=UPI001FE4C3B2|nr:DNA translocase FtsK [Chthonobacter rhizosphaerae]
MGSPDKTPANSPGAAASGVRPGGGPVARPPESHHERATLRQDPRAGTSHQTPVPVHEIVAATFEEIAVPSWFQPFIAVPNVRFTRTPDVLRRRRAGQDAPDGEPEAADGEDPASAAAEVQASAPAVRPDAAPSTPAVPAAGRPSPAARPGAEAPAGRAAFGPAAPGPLPGLRAAGPTSPITARPAQPVAARPAEPDPAPAAPDFRPPAAAPLAVRPRAVVPPKTARPAPVAEAPASVRQQAPAVEAASAPWDDEEETPVLPDEILLAETNILGLTSMPAIRATAVFAWPAYDPVPDEVGVASEPAYEWVDSDEAEAVEVSVEPTGVEAEPADAFEAASAEDAEPVDVIAPDYAVPDVVGPDQYGYELPPLALLTDPPNQEPSFDVSAEFLDKNSLLLQQTLHDFGVRGEIIDASPGPVVTLYELEPAPGTKSSRVISLSSDISRSMSAISARVAVVEGRNVIGIELPNARRETVWLRELLASHDFAEARAKLGICLGKTIGGDPVIADLARMPHLLVAGTTGSGKSVAINTMILSLLYRLKPEECRLIMIDPKMLELSVYEGIPHLLTPVVTDPRKAVVALKWAVREMEDRYKKMSRLAVRNIDGFNARMVEARARHAALVAAGRDEEAETFAEEMEGMTPLPYIVVIVDEMADLMMVAGKDIEGAIQRLAQMARAAGIHLIMATQRPSVDVITGTIKANFPTRISFQVTSKIDSRTILGEMGAEQLLGQGDMLYMAGGGRITRVHGPFVSDQEVEKVVAHLKVQGRPEYLDAVTASDEAAGPPPAPKGGGDTPVMDAGEFTLTPEEVGGDLYAQAVALVLRDRKASTSYVQRRLQIGYNRAASLMEQMEKEGIVGQANHAGKREIFGIGHSAHDDD